MEIELPQAENRSKDSSWLQPQREYLKCTCFKRYQIEQSAIKGQYKLKVANFAFKRKLLNLILCRKTEFEPFDNSMTRNDISYFQVSV